jgi:hypothetical protein
MNRPCFVCARPNDVENQIIGGLKSKPVAHARKGHKALELVIPIGPATDDLQREIDFRRSAEPPH